MKLVCVAQVDTADARGGAQPETADTDTKTAEATDAGNEELPAVQPNFRERLASLLEVLKELFLFSADSPERKQGIRRLYIKHHPDKTQDDIEESTVCFTALQPSSKCSSN
jgi:hypothetical protein